MKVDFTKAFQTIEGEPLYEADNKKALTLKKVAIESLLAVFEDERNLSGEEKVKRYELALKISGNEIVDLKAEDIALIKKLITKGYSSLVVGQAWKMIEENNG